MPRKRPYRKTRRKLTGQNLFRGGWGLFLISLLLPAVTSWEGWLYGWQCLLLAAVAFFSGIRSMGPMIWLQMGLCTAANLLALCAPLLWRQGAKNPGLLRGMSVFYAVAMLNSALLFSPGSIGHFNIGFYAWLASFGLLATGFQMEGRRLSRRKQDAVQAEEVAATGTDERKARYEQRGDTNMAL